MLTPHESAIGAWRGAGYRRDGPTLRTQPGDSRVGHHDVPISG